MIVYILAALLVIAAIIIGSLVVSLSARKGISSQDLLRSELANMQRSVIELKDSVDLRLSRSQTQLTSSLQKQFSDSSKIIADVNQRLAKFEDTNKRVIDVAEGLKTLQNVLQNPKQRGVLGEYYLDQVLKNVLPPNRYRLQQSLGKDDQGREMVCDAVILLDKGKKLPVDSKFSLENYNRWVEAKSGADKKQFAQLFRQDLKKRIDETAKYIQPSEGTMDYAFMFIPSEAIYYDLLVNKVGDQNGSGRDLLEYAFREKQVIIVSPTTFMAYLQTVLQGLRGLEIEEQAKDIRLRVGQLGRHIVAFEEYLLKLGNSLGTSVGHYNKAHRELSKIDKDVVRISGGKSSVEPLLLERPTANDD